MKAVCLGIGDLHSLTVGKYYTVLQLGSDGNSYLLTDDIGETKWFDRDMYGILQILIATDIWVEYIGNRHSGLTKGCLYNLLDRRRSDEYFYFMNDDSEFVGVSKINYIGGAPNFRVLSKDDIRDKNINDILV